MQKKKEVTIHELRKMLLNEEITQDDFVNALIQTLGARKVADALYETMFSTYSETLLTDEIPEALDALISKRTTFSFASEPRRFSRPITEKEENVRL